MPAEAPRHFNLFGQEPPSAISLNGFKLWAYQVKQTNDTTVYIPFLPGTDSHDLTYTDIARVASHFSHQPPDLTDFSFAITPTPPWVKSKAPDQLVITVFHPNSMPELHID